MLDIGALIFALYFVILVLLMMGLLVKFLPFGRLGKPTSTLQSMEITRPVAEAIEEPAIKEPVKLKVPVKMKTPKRAPVLEGWKPEKRSKVFDMATPIRMGSVPRPEIGEEEEEEFEPLTDERLAEIAKPKKKRRG